MIEHLRTVLEIASREILNLSERLDADFESACRWILDCDGRVVTTGIGKAGDIAKKASSTFSSTGTTSLFLHAADAVHGDLGMVNKNDLVLIYTNSGETDEILRLYPPLRQICARTILITGRPSSTAARMSDLVLNVEIEREACPHNLAPTTSTTVMMALSDALALAVMRERQFSKEDYALFHPQGSLGRRLLMRVSDAMRKGDDLALVSPNTSFTDVLHAITQAGAGAAIVVDDQQQLLGIITDGDIRRRFELSGTEQAGTIAADMMNANPQCVDVDALAVEVLDMFENLPKKIGEMPVVSDGKVVGLVMLKDLVRLGLG
ncbi:MAG: KpsF/GutQ family sugar-phosphate isomerase [Fimbriimonadales bacterium]